MSPDPDGMEIDKSDEPPRLPKDDTEAELDEKYPNRPHNHSKTLAFHSLFEQLYNPLSENKKKPTGPVVNRRRQGPHGAQRQNPHEIRRNIIDSYIARWRKEVGDDIYPAFRLILPENDRERAMYGLKEKALAKMLVRVMKIDKNSEDGFALLNWKLPGQGATSRMAGDFAGRCFEVISKRPMRTNPGDMSIAEVNNLLDQLAAAPREENQLPIIRKFYNCMNAEEMMWLVRVILRQMKIGASEKTIFDLWHPDAETLFNVSSSLRRVCWELHDPLIRLENEDRGVNLMQCFQPQLAQFQMHTIPKMIQKMGPTEDDPVFWIEEKLDGERMQLHMMTDESVPGGKRFAFWSRKAKDYTYLYGNGLEDPDGALTRHLGNVFHQGVRNIILDGEMITWDPKEGAQVPFGTLKSAAIEQQRNPFAGGERPKFCVFDILYLNDQPLTRYTLRDRYAALEKSIKEKVDGRFELHPHEEATTPSEVEKKLQKMVELASEGLVLKNPRSAYRLNDRNDDWMKVKPEYMAEFGENLDCVIIGGYYGSGHRGGKLSSFLCGLRVGDGSSQSQRVHPEKCFSFFKVGGGLTAADYAKIRHQTEGKWHTWDPKHPPTEYIELAGGNLQIERPDEWIKPSDSVVVCAKAASVNKTDSFRTGQTLRFPRFKRLRMDKTWETALSLQEFLEIKASAEKENKEKTFKVDNARKRPKIASRKKPLTVSGYEAISQPSCYTGPQGQIFKGLSFYVLSDGTKPEKKTKAELENMIKANGGTVYQTYTKSADTICVAEKNVVRVASIKKHNEVVIVKPIWLFDCIKQAEVDARHGFGELILPYEPERHLFFTPEKKEKDFKDNADQFGDSYARTVEVDELREIFANMPAPDEGFQNASADNIRQRLSADGAESRDAPGTMFKKCVLHFDADAAPMLNGVLTSPTESPLPQSISWRLAKRTARFAGAKIAERVDDESVTHVIAHDGSDLQKLRKAASVRKKVPRIVTLEWIDEGWREGTLLDEERFVAR
ncbi:MAG: hypothetical protein Q9227_008908 [Pyrenula ochraceoflavens]